MDMIPQDNTPRKQRQLEYNRAYYASHRKEISEQRKGYYQKNQEHLRQYSAQYRVEHPEEVKQSNARYNEEHTEQRRTSKKRYNAAHRQERKIYKDAWHEEHREEQRQYSAEYNATHHEERLSYYRQRRTEHREELNARNRHYRNTDRARMLHRMHENNRRARKLAAPGIHTAQDVRKQYERQHGTCYWCGKKSIKYHVDHVIPLSRGGSNWPDNIVIACPTCNLKRTNKLPHEFYEGGRLL